MNLGTLAAVLTRPASGPPAWLPAGAVAFVDFVNSRYYAGGAVRSIAELLTGYDPAYLDATGLYIAFDGSNAPLAAGALLSDLAVQAPAGATLVFDCAGMPIGWNGVLFYFYDAATGPTSSVQFGAAGQASSVDLTDFDEISLALSTGLNTTGANKFAYTINRDLGGGSWQYGGSVNGETEVTDTASYDHFAVNINPVLGFQLGGYSTFSEFDAKFRSMTLYPAMAPSSLPSLST